jgi:hypothetical protein
MRALGARFPQNVGKGVGKDEEGDLHRRQASRQLLELAQQARRNRRKGGVDL